MTTAAERAWNQQYPTGEYQLRNDDGRDEKNAYDKHEELAGVCGKTLAEVALERGNRGDDIRR